ncbi:MAG: hypothetical protein V4632_08230 [Pseudomonadota bacterium]
MKRFAIAILCAAVLALTGCATSQSVTLGTTNPPKAFGSGAASLIPQEGNSASMDINVTQYLQASGISVKAPVAAGTRQASDVDMLVAYSDVWRWDLVMYLKTVNVNIFEAKSGNLVVTGRWDNSPLHGFQDPNQIIKELMSEMMAKVKQVTERP